MCTALPAQRKGILRPEHSHSEETVANYINLEGGGEVDRRKNQNVDNVRRKVEVKEK